jgi:mycothiol synthase
MPHADLRIREADRNDLAALYDLTRASLTHDAFSADLLAEKLFRVPRPGQEQYRVYLAEAAGQPVGMLQSVSRPALTKGWVGLFAVRAERRREGIATAMLERALDDWRRVGIREVEVLAIPGNYFNPGLDPRYTEALSFLERCGFERFKDCVNLRGSLDQRFDIATDEQRLATAGLDVRRARPDDGPVLDAFFGEHFGPDWRLEAQLAMDNTPPALHLAFRDRRMIAFSAHSTQNREWGFFGPMGTAPAARGTGIGRVLLLRCLNDLHDAGHRTTVIPWVGPIAFYCYHANCRVERVFWRYHKMLDAKA